MNANLTLYALRPEVELNCFRDGWDAAMQSTEEISPFYVRLSLPEKVIFNDPATIVYWDDGTKTVVKCQPGDIFSAETGLITAMLKKYMGNDNTFNRVVNEWLKRTGQYHPAPSVLPDPICVEPPALPDPDCMETPASEAKE